MFPVLRWHAVPQASTDMKDKDAYKKQQMIDAAEVTLSFCLILIYWHLGGWLSAVIPIAIIINRYNVYNA